MKPNNRLGHLQSPISKTLKKIAPPPLIKEKDNAN
jgi:hypothetical protein